MIVLLDISGGCGDGVPEAGDRTYSVEAATTMTATSITKAHYVEHINKVCRQAWGRILELFNEDRQKHPKIDARDRFAGAVRGPLLGSITFLIFDDMRMLGAPRGEEGAIEKIIGPLQATVELGQKHRVSFYSATEIERHFAIYNRRARRYGLEECLVTAPHLRNIEA